MAKWMSLHLSRRVCLSLLVGTAAIRDTTAQGQGSTEFAQWVAAFHARTRAREPYPT